MVVLSNRRLGLAAELVVSNDVAAQILRELANAAAPLASARWEHELVTWLVFHASALPDVIDVGDLGWTPDHFDVQRRFVTSALARAAITSDHASALDHLRKLIDLHPRDAVQFGRRWRYLESDKVRDDAVECAGGSAAAGDKRATDLPLGG